MGGGEGRVFKNVRMWRVEAGGMRVKIWRGECR